MAMMFPMVVVMPPPVFMMGAMNIAVYVMVNDNERIIALFHHIAHRFARRELWRIHNGRRLLHHARNLCGCLYFP